MIGPEKLEELELAFNKEELGILGLAEIRKMGESIVQTKEGNPFRFIGSAPGQKTGVGFLNSTKWRIKLELFKDTRTLERIS